MGFEKRREGRDNRGLHCTSQAPCFLPQELNSCSSLVTQGLFVMPVHKGGTRDSEKLGQTSGDDL